MSKKARKEVRLADWLPDEVKQFVPSQLSRFNEIRELQELLLTDERMKSTWKELCAEKEEYKRRKNLCDFIHNAPTAYLEGKRLKAAHSEASRNNIEALQDCQRGLKNFKRTLSRLSALGIPEIITTPLHASTDALERWMREQLESYELSKAPDYWHSFNDGLEYEEVLDRLKKRGAENFDETYTFAALARLFQMIFGKTKNSMIAYTVIVLKKLDVEHEDMRLRVNAVVKNNLRKTATRTRR